MNFSLVLDSWTAWPPLVGGLPDPAVVEGSPDVKALPMMMRRRLSALGKMVMSVGDQLHKGEPSTVFTSSNGDATVTLDLLQALAAGEQVSPAGFTKSVHNAYIGQLSILHKNHQASTAIAAGVESFLAGLLEVYGQLEEYPGRDVLLVHADEKLPAFYDVNRSDSPVLFAAAFLFKAVGETRLQFEVSKKKTSADCGDPCVSFVQHLSSGTEQWCWHGGGRHEWHCKKVLV